MKPNRPNYRWVTTRSEYEWDGERYVEISNEGYWYDGPWSLAMDVDAVYVAEDYKWINDNGSITTATQVAAENTAVTTGFSPGDNIRLRVNFGETASAQGAGLDTGSWTLQFSVDGAAFATVGAATDVKYFDSTNLTNGTVIAIGNHILNWSGSEVPQAWGDENEDGVTPSQTWSNDVAEAEFSIQFDSAVSDTAVITFRMLGPDASVVTFTNVPTITLEAAAGGVDIPRTPPVGSMAIAGALPSVSEGAYITPDAGSMAVAGYSPPIIIQPPYGMQLTGSPPSQGVGVSTTASTMAMVGYEPGVVLAGAEDTAITPPAGAMVVSGNAPAQDTAITVPTGSMTITGQVPTAHVPIIIVPDTEVMLMVGYEPSISGSANHIRAPPAGSMSITGAVPEIAVSITPIAGSLAITGYEPSVSVDAPSEAITPPVGSMAISGQLPTQDVGISPVPGAISAAGYIPGVLNGADHIITPDTGSMSVAGAVPALGLSITPPVGSMVVAGSLPTIQTDTDTAITPPAGAIVAAGYAAPIIIQPPYGLQLVGYEPSVINAAPSDTQITPPSGSMVIAGNLPTIATAGDTPITPPVGSMVLAGYVPGVLSGTDQAITPPAGSLTVAGIAPYFEIVISGAAASWQFTGHVPTVQIGDSVGITPPAGSMTIASYIPSLQFGTQITPPAGSMAVTGYIPGQGVGITPDSGAISTAGYASALGVDHVITPDSGSISVTGYVPTLQASWRITPPAGSLVITGHQPSCINTGDKKGGRRPRRYVVDVDGQIFEVRTQVEAQRILQQIRELAREQVEADEPIKPVKITVRTAAGKQSRSSGMLSDIRKTRNVVQQAIQKQSKIKREREIDREIAILFSAKIAREEDEDAILALLL